MYVDEVVIVKKVLFEDESIQLLETIGGAGKAILYRTFFQKVQQGDEVVVNVTATTLQLGTGGWDIVKAVPNALPYKKTAGNGHIMKARYMPNQHSVLTVEAQESKDHSLFQTSFCLDGQSILLAELHSMLPLVYVFMRKYAPEMKLTVIISDEAALPLMLSEHIRVLKKEKHFHSITVGQAFGGEFEAVNIVTALQYAVQKLKSDLILISLGPGVVGTGTVYGFSGMELANWANIVGGLGGKPIWIPRVSFADDRERHKGISHHTLTPLTKFTFSKSLVPLPTLTNEQQLLLEQQVNNLNKQHSVIWVEQKRFKSLLENALVSYPKQIKTMGRTYEDDPVFFYTVAAAVYSAFTINDTNIS
ncbi:DUF3866 family protein [Alkalihalobacillus sp. BA299]|uniref:DUF3866 family protein n=1 Tax=Alkalihalobacillus sp. BA299 TaxID=2815938 RepID=UPI001ADB71C6|nr:DUF3866 family protein [Alkalihalobacillus sp. BA299]